MSERKLITLEEVTQSIVDFQQKRGNLPEETTIAAIMDLKKIISDWIVFGTAITATGVVHSTDKIKRQIASANAVTNLEDVIDRQGIVLGMNIDYKSKFGIDISRLDPSFNRNMKFYIVGSQLTSGLRYWAGRNKGRMPTFEYIGSPKKSVVDLKDLIENGGYKYVATFLLEKNIKLGGPSSLINARPLLNAIFMRFADYDAFGSVSDEAMGKGEIPPFDKRHLTS